MKKKLNSWALGTISVGLSVVSSFIITGITDYLSIREILTMDASDRLGKILTAIFYGLILIFSIFAFIRGIKESRTQKRGVVVLGLVLSSVAFIAALFIGYLSLAFYAL